MSPEVDVRNRAAVRYARGGHRRVAGWLSDGAIRLIQWLDLQQKAIGIRGHAAEIGVHHGKLLILLALLLRSHETAVAIDVFENQSLNVDRSGKGDLPAFWSNVDRHGGERDRIRVIAADSRTLRSEDVVGSAGGRVRLFSVDGGHTAETTCHDLAVASGSLCDGGVVLLDDYFNESWPEVSEGTNRFFHERGILSLVPFAIGGNKVFFTTDRNRAESYLDELERARVAVDSKRTTLFGSPVLSCGFVEPDWKTGLRRTKAWRWLRDKAAGRMIKRVIGQS